MKILISGASGFVGSALVDLLMVGNNEIFKLTRSRSHLLPHEIFWDPRLGILDLDLLEGFDGIIHLSGEPIFSRWTLQKKQEIRDSRIKGTQLLSEKMSRLKRPPKVFISASAIGYYGDSGDKLRNETSPQGKGFLAEVCAEWEAATAVAETSWIRTVHLRIGVVLSGQGGALKRMLLPFKMGLGGPIGSGQQYMSWIHIQDLVNIIYYSLKQEALRGPVNAVSPFPVTNQVFTETLASQLHRPAVLRVPACLMRLIFGQVAEETLLASQKVEPAVLLEHGFQFRHPGLREALENILKPL